MTSDFRRAVHAQQICVLLAGVSARNIFLEMEIYRPRTKRHFLPSAHFRANRASSWRCLETLFRLLLFRDLICWRSGGACSLFAKSCQEQLRLGRVRLHRRAKWSARSVRLVTRANNICALPITTILESLLPQKIANFWETTPATRIHSQKHKTPKWFLEVF
jgi:hypothetical protein